MSMKLPAGRSVLLIIVWYIYASSEPHPTLAGGIENVATCVPSGIKKASRIILSGGAWNGTPFRSHMTERMRNDSGFTVDVLSERTSDG